MASLKMKFYIIQLFFIFKTPEYYSNLGTLHMIVFILPKLFSSWERAHYHSSAFYTVCSLINQSKSQKRETQMWFLVQGVQGQVLLSIYSPFLPWQKVSQAMWTQTVVTPNTFVTGRPHKHIIFPSEGQCGHLEAENNSEQQRVSMPAVTPPPVQRRVLRPSQHSFIPFNF